MSHAVGGTSTAGCREGKRSPDDVLRTQRGAAISRGQPEPPPQLKQRINEAITASRVRLVGPAGEQIGVVPLREALNAAREAGLDLVEVAAGADPPVCKILDHGKWQYVQMKKQREARKMQKVVEIKEIRLRPKTHDHDTGVKIKRAIKFLEDGMKVKVRIQFRGREITHPEIALELLTEVAEQLAVAGEVEQQPSLEGRSMLMVLAPRRDLGKTDGRPARTAPVKLVAPDMPEPEPAPARGGAARKGAAAGTPVAAEAPAAEAPAAESPAATGDGGGAGGA